MQDQYTVRVLPARAEPPFDLWQLCDWLCIEIDYRPLPPNVSGFYVRVDGEPVIAINSRDISRRRRWTLAHEIAHHMLGLSRSSAAFDLQLAPNGEELCNHFAAELLMPASAVRKALSVTRLHGRALILDLARQFDVSRAAMQNRLADLKREANVPRGD